MERLRFYVYLGEMSIWNAIGKVLEIVNGYVIFSKIQSVYLRCSKYVDEVVESDSSEVGPLEVESMYRGVM
jgi:hypothetical protein